MPSDSASKTGKARRSTLVLLAKLAVTAGLIWWVLTAIDLESAATRMAEANPSWLFLALLLATVQIWLLVLRWHRLVRTQIQPFSPGEAFYNLLTGLFFNQALPSGIGGDAMRIWLLTRGRPGRSGDAVSVILSDRAIGLIALVVIAVVMAPVLVLGPSGERLGGGSGGAVAVSLGLLAALVVGGYVFLFLVRHLPTLRLPGWLWLQHAYAVVRRVMVGSRQSILFMVLAVLAHLALLFALAAIAIALAIPVPLTAILVLTPPAMILATLPISIAGWGIREAGFVAVLALVGIDATDATLLGLAAGLLQLIQGLAGGAVWVIGKRQIAVAAAGVLPSASRPDKP